MMEKMERALVALFVKAQLELMKLEQEEDGMETVETIILVAVAVVVAGILIDVLTKDGTSGKGLIGDVFAKIQEKITELFDR